MQDSETALFFIVYVLVWIDHMKKFFFLIFFSSFVFSINVWYFMIIYCIFYREVLLTYL